MSFNNRQANVHIVDQGSTSDAREVEVSQSEKEALLYKYYPEYYKQKEIEKREPQKPKRYDAEADHNPYSNEYYDTKYTNMDLGEDSLDIKIEIKTNMKL